MPTLYDHFICRIYMSTLYVYSICQLYTPTIYVSAICRLLCILYLSTLNVYSMRILYVYSLYDRLGGVMVKASALRAEDRGSIPGRFIPKTLKIEF